MMCFRAGLTNLKVPFDAVRRIVPHCSEVHSQQSLRFDLRVFAARVPAHVSNQNRPQ